MNDQFVQGSGGRRRPLVVLAGNIAVGKTTMTPLLADALGASGYLESVADNPFLERYYADMPAWTFHLNMYFLADRARQLVAAASAGPPAVLDRSFYEDRIFVEQAHSEGRTADDTYAVFCELETVLAALLPRPAVLVYLEAPVPALLRRIAVRGRAFESGITEVFLDDLQSRYDDWIASYSSSPVIRVDTEATDLRVDSAAFTELVAQVVRHLDV